MQGSLKLITPPELEPVNLAEVKALAHIDYDDEDSLISSWIKSARIMAEEFQRRSYLSQVWELSLDCFPDSGLLIPRPPLVSVESVKYYNIENVEFIYNIDDLIIDTDSEPGRLCLAYGKVWPSTILREINAVKIRFTAGYGKTAEDVPESIKEAIKIYCTARNENRSGELDIPEAFYNLLRPNRVYL